MQYKLRKRILRFIIDIIALFILLILGYLVFENFEYVNKSKIMICIAVSIVLWDMIDLWLFKPALTRKQLSQIQGVFFCKIDVDTLQMEELFELSKAEIDWLKKLMRKDIETKFNEEKSVLPIGIRIVLREQCRLVFQSECNPNHLFLTWEDDEEPFDCYVYITDTEVEELHKIFMKHTYENY